MSQQPWQRPRAVRRHRPPGVAQWRSVNGVSRWLFVDQLIASLGFAWHSFRVVNAVFVATPVVLAITALIGPWVRWRPA